MAMIERRFLGAGTHLLHALADELVVQSVGEELDLSGHLVVLPTSRARWRLESLLLDRSADAGMRLVPPEMLTPGSLLDRLIVPQRSLASGLASGLAWLEAVHALDADTRQDLLGYDDLLSVAESHALAQRLDRVCRELSAIHLDPSDVADRCESMGVMVDRDRWSVITTLRMDMLERLASMNLDDRDDSHRHAIYRGNLHLHGVSSITLIAAEIPDRMRRVLELAAESGVSVTNIVHGDEATLGAVFQADGTLDIDSWRTRGITLNTDDITMVPAVDDQIAAAFEYAADLGEVVADQIRFIVPDESLLPSLEAAAIAEGVPLEHFEGPPASESRVGQLLGTLIDVTDHHTASTLSDLIRHPDVTWWLQDHGVSTPVTTWDDMWRTHVPGSIDDLVVVANQDDEVALLKPIVKLYETLETPRPASDWAAVLMDILTDVFDHGEQDVIQDAAFESLHTVLTDLHELPAGLDEMHAVDAIRLIQSQLAGSSTPSHTHTGGIEVLGWLDAHLDDAPHLVLTGLNEGVLPTAASVDAWLPEVNRAALGLACRSRREARDAFLFEAILQSGRSTRLVCPKRDNNGEPLPPSSLLLRISGEPLAHRIITMMSSDTTECAPTLAGRRPIFDKESSFDPKPMPVGTPQIASMSVTSFKRFIDNPYTFLIERDKRIKSQEVSTAHELDAMGFGNLIHAAVEQWGKEEMDRGVPETNPDSVVRDMHAALDHYVAQNIGDHPLPGVALQLAMAKHRLSALGPVQAVRAVEGWRIHSIEQFYGFGGDADVRSKKFPGRGGLYLTGKIDRVDVHETHGYQALDYKSGRKATGADGAHRKGRGKDKTWRDLQLPLYRVLLRGTGIEVPAGGLGYILVPPDASQCRIDIAANWTETMLEDAEKYAAEIVETITSGRILEAAEEQLA